MTSSRKPVQLRFKEICLAENCCHPAEDGSEKLYGLPLCIFHIEALVRRGNRLEKLEDVIRDRRRRGGIKPND